MVEAGNTIAEGMEENLSLLVNEKGSSTVQLDFRVSGQSY